MKVLILSCNTGEGHNSSAKALKKCMDAKGIRCDVEDTIGLVSEHISRGVSDVYVYSTRNSLFERSYKLGGLVSELNGNLKSPVYMANKLYAKKLYDHIVDNRYDAVIAVHLFPAEALTALKRNADLCVPTVFVMTDYTCIPFLPETELDRYVIAHEDLVEEYVEKGIPRGKIVPVGIPVDERKFAFRTEKSQARENVAEEFGWKGTDMDGKWYLIMSGSMGFGNLDGLIVELLSRINEDDRVICVCGRNESLREKLSAEFAEDRAFSAVGFTDKISVLMDACDVLFTKPGGITSTEAAIKNIPLVHTAPIPGLEDYNARFFHYHNMSYSTTDVAQQAVAAIRLCHDDAWRQRMLDAQKRNANPHTCEDIAVLVEELVRRQGTSEVVLKG